MSLTQKGMLGKYKVQCGKVGLTAGQYPQALLFLACHIYTLLAVIYYSCILFGANDGETLRTRSQMVKQMK